MVLVVDLGLAAVLANFFVLTAAPTLPVVVDLMPACLPLLTLLTIVEGLAKPFDSGALDLTRACAFNHPSKSGSPPSSKLLGGCGSALVSAGVSKGEASANSPQASSISSSSSMGFLKYCSVGVETRAGVDAPVTAWRCRVDTDAEKGEREDSITGGLDDDLSLFDSWGFATLDCMSPLAVASLFVKDEIAQPAHPVVSFCGVPMRGIAPFATTTAGGGKIVSGSEFPYLRIRWR